MKTLTTLSLRFGVLLLVATALVAGGCDDAVVDSENGETGNGGDTDIEVPSAYSFESRFVEGESSVAYPGQTVRYLLIQDLKIKTDRLASEGASAVTKDELMRYYGYEDSYDMETLTGTGDFETLLTHYSEIATGKDLVGKATAEYGNETLIGRDVTADELIRAYLDSIATRSQNPDNLGTPAAYTTTQGLDLSQLVNKLLLGSVVYAQGTDKYLGITLDSDNSGPDSEGSPYSTMEHVWDESFGYFGAPRDFGNYTDQEVADGTIYKDANGDGAIDFRSEYVFTFAGYAADRDVGGSGVDFSGELFQAYLEGRTAIVNEASTEEIAAARDEAARIFEKIVAANVIHYVNSTLSDMEEVTESQVEEKNNAELNEHWAEAKGFAWALQYNDLPVSQIGDTELEELHDLLGSVPPYAVPGSEDADQYRSDLQEAKTVLQDALDFSDENVQNW